MTKKPFCYPVPRSWTRTDQPRTKRSLPRPKRVQLRSDPQESKLGAAFLEEEFYRAHDVRERCVNVELYRRDRYHEILKRHCPELATVEDYIASLDAQIRSLRAELKRRNQRANAKLKTSSNGDSKPVVVVEEEDCRELTDLKDQRNAAYGDLKTRRSKFLRSTGKPASLVLLEEQWKKTIIKLGLSKRTLGSPVQMKKQPPSVINQWEELQEKRAAWREMFPYRQEELALEGEMKKINRRLYNTSGLAWDTAGQIQQEAKKLSEGPPPRHHRYEGAGSLTLQLKGGGLPVGDLLSGACSRVRLEMLRPLRTRNGADTPDVFLMELVTNINSPIGGKFTKKGLQKRPRGNQCQELRVPFVMHRPLPMDGLVKLIKIVRHRHGPQMETQIQFTVDYVDHRPVASEGCVGVALCQQHSPRGLLIAVAVGSDNQLYYLTATDKKTEGLASRFVVDSSDILTSCWIDGLLDLFRRSDDYQAALDQVFEETSELLVDYLNNTYEWNIPQWMRGPLQGFGKEEHQPWWRQNHLLMFMDVWEQYGDVRDPFYKNVLAPWRAKDWRLYCASEALQVKAERVRLDAYRKFSTLLAKTYRTLYLPDTDYAELGRLPDVGEKDDKIAWRKYKNIAALGKLRACLEQRAACTEKVNVDKIPLVCPRCCRELRYKKGEPFTEICCGSNHQVMELKARRLLAQRAPESSKRQRKKERV